MAFNYNQLLSQLNPMNYNQRQIVTVNGFQEARNYALNRDESIILRDANEDVIYVKVCDEVGKSTIKAYECKDITENLSVQINPQYVNRSDFDRLTSEIADMKKMFSEAINGKHDVRQYDKRTQSFESDKTVQQKSEK